MAVMAAKLTGTSLAKPQQTIPYNLWAVDNAGSIDKAVDAQCRTQNVTKKKGVNVHSTITRLLFMALPPDVRDKWEARAKAEHAEAVASWTEAIERPASTNSEDRQR